jgi:hypothetical protein
MAPTSKSRPQEPVNGTADLPLLQLLAETSADDLEA